MEFFLIMFLFSLHLCYLDLLDLVLSYITIFILTKFFHDEECYWLKDCHLFYYLRGAYEC